MLKPFTTLLVLCLSLWASGADAASTLERDFEQPINIDADKEFFDLRNNIFRVEGHVIVTQGSLVIHADQLEVEGFGSDENQAELFIATGSPATYSQQVEENVTVTASAQVITYDAATRTLTLTGNAELEQSGSFLKASEITYDLENQVISAKRGDEPGQRVRTSFQPREQQADQGNN
ncbi:lipopolysaccharide transport periplasmic protein LptA [Aliidiomarina taiwanensis]|uniref:Lipopolysaccharide export system protein LptA n=1 Tax=Aliidiomarina taiwanensis TaxID=946228 RepID=A0A432X7N1_9GAMM|nr:lipopolysaccharide transport periplasmic protein LptA [Aliidiomarina taiwanensis]RUO42855.1 lipopolysaccharide transport periplasmic protein LptA [Aliidiomarina taiwanensis]